jgi:oligoendopeptidase F
VPAADRWNLKSLYADEAAWESDFLKMKGLRERIAGFKGKASASAASLKECLDFFRDFGLLSERLGEYAFLRQCEDEGSSPDRERVTRFTMEATRAEGEASWLEPEIQSMPEGLVESWLADPGLGEYAVFLKKLLRFKPHILSEKEERLLALQSEHAATPHNAFSVLTDVDLSFGSIETPQGDIPLSQSSWTWFMNREDRSLREKAYKRFYGVFDAHKNTLAALYQGSVQHDRYQALVRNFPSARARALFPDAVEESVYDNLVSAVATGLPALHRFYGLKKRVLKLPDFRHWDAYVSMVPGVETDYPYEKAVETIRAAVSPLGKEYADTLAGGLLSGWVDRYENRGKRSGAFSSGSYRNEPFILMNYKADVLRDLFTLAHEGGHSMHSKYSSANNPFMSYHYAIFEAEVASTFNEELLFRHLYAGSDSPRLKAYLLNMRLDNIISTVIRQTMFAEFERDSHALLEADKPLSLDALRGAYRGLLQKYFGPGTVLEPESDLECLRIPHFYRAFYVYKYATGLSASIALAKRVCEGGERERQDYFAFLKSGGSRYPIESLRLAGVDMASPGPVLSAMEIFTEGVGELEKLL